MRSATHAIESRNRTRDLSIPSRGSRLRGARLEVGAGAEAPSGKDARGQSFHNESETAARSLTGAGVMF